MLPEMACKLTPDCDLIFGILNCNLLKDTIDVDLRVHTLWGIYTYKKDRHPQVSKYSPWGTKIKPFPSLQKKMTEFLRQRPFITTPYANRSYQKTPMATATKRCNLVTLTRPNTEKLSQPRKVNIEPLPKAKPKNWEATASRKASPLPSQQMDQLINPQFNLVSQGKILCDLHPFRKIVP